MVQVLCPVVVGRRHEAATLDAALGAALDGRGGCAVLVGEAGIGKSRLAAETAKRARDLGAMAVVGRASPDGTAGAYRPLTEALSQALRQVPLPTDKRLQPWLPALGGIIAQAHAGAATAEFSAAFRGEAVVQLLSYLSEPAGLLVVLEDLHWADPDTLAIVEYLVGNLDSERVLCVLTVRSEEPSAALELLHRQRGRPGALHLELSRLNGPEVQQMVRTCMPQADPATVDRICSNADGVPLLVEELLASPGLPKSFTDTVRRRLELFDAEARPVIDLAAILGYRFDWRLLAPASGRPEQVVVRALGEAVERTLLRVEDGAFRFRHALTRDAVLAELLPPLQASLARAALEAVRAGYPNLDGERLDLAVELARRSGDTQEEAALLTEAGRRGLARGALATAIDALKRAVELSDDERATGAALLLVETLALAGRVEEALAAGRDALLRLPEGAPRAELHLGLAGAAVSAGRWTLAGEQLSGAAADAASSPDPALAARIAVLDAEVALATGDEGRAATRAAEALGHAERPSGLRCHALEVLGRIERFRDHLEARRLFEEALRSADAAGLPVWRTRALHELGTIDMFDHLGTELLDRARSSAEEQGALSTAATLDLQLAAVNVSRWAPDRVAAHGEAARTVAEALGLGEVRDKALLFLAESCALRADAEGVERYLALIPSARSGETPLHGFAWGIRAEAALTSGDIKAASDGLDQAAGILDRLPRAEPAAFRALRPLLLAAAADPRAAEAVERVLELGVGAFSLNRGLLGYAESVLAGRQGESERALAVAAAADRSFVNCPTWLTLARVLAADAASADGWGRPAAWLNEGVDMFNRTGLPGLASWCRERLPDGESRQPPAVTAREHEVLRLVVEGLSNKEIAADLRVSPRTVEKHVESLLRKTGTRSRTQLAVQARGSGGQGSISSRKA